MSTWNTEERAGLGNTAGYIQKLIQAPLKRNSGKGNFDLFYFRPDFRNNTKKLDKTLLFCSGGPGRVIKPHDTMWFRDLSVNGYKIVYFHLRGSGFSQLPESSEYDEYIRTEYAAYDIEKIREDVFETDNRKPWDAVIGYSYGAVLAQQYASQCPEFVNKLILIGPISLDKFMGKIDAAKVYDEYEKAVNEIRISIIDKIYELRIFSDDKSDLHISADQKNEIKESLFRAQGVFERIEENFASEQSVIDNYEILSATSSTGESLLQRKRLNYERPFFQALRELHRYGRRTDNDGAVNQEAKLAEIGEVIAMALNHLPPRPPLCHPQDVGGLTNAPRSKRVFDVMGVYDGINKRFIKEWLLDESKDVTECIKRASGSAWMEIPDYKHWSDKIGIPEGTTSITPWTPAKHAHTKSTLILKGSADPVTAAGQAESYLEYVGGQQSILLNFDGVGHEFILPGVRVDGEGIHPILHGGNANTLNCLLYAFIENDFDNFKRIAKPIWEALKAEEKLPVEIIRSPGPRPPARDQVSLDKHS